MNIHKFNKKPKTIPSKTTPSKTIHWQPLREVTYPALKINSMTWKILNLNRRKLNNYN